MATEPPVASNTLSSNLASTSGDSAQIPSAESNDVQASTSRDKRRRVEEEDEQENKGNAVEDMLKLFARCSIEERRAFKYRAHEIEVRPLLDFEESTISDFDTWFIRELNFSRP